MKSWMKRVIARTGILFLLPLLAWLAPHADAQQVPALDNIKSQPELDKAIATLDAQLFDSYNRCDLAKFSSLLDDNVEFYHDQGGVTLGKDNLTESIKKNICGTDTHRELVPGTLQIYSLKGYGAVEIGVHRFLSFIPGQTAARAKPASSPSGNTKMAPGKSRAPSASTTTPLSTS